MTAVFGVPVSVEIAGTLANGIHYGTGSVDLTSDGTTKEAAYRDDFEDGVLDGWTVSSAQVADGWVTHTSDSSWRQFRRPQTNPDGVFKFSYKYVANVHPDDRLYVFVRYVDNNNWLAAYIEPVKLSLVQKLDGVWHFNSNYSHKTPADVDVVYDVKVVCSGTRVEFWRRVHDDDNPVPYTLCLSRSTEISTTNEFFVSTASYSEYLVGDISICGSSRQPCFFAR